MPRSWVAAAVWLDCRGENGFFRIVTSTFNGGQGDKYNLGLETDCAFGAVAGWEDAANLGIYDGGDDQQTPAPRSWVTPSFLQRVAGLTAPINRRMSTFATA